MHISRGDILSNRPLSHISDLHNIDLDLGSGQIWQTVLYHLPTSTYIPNFVEIGKLCGWTETDVQAGTETSFINCQLLQVDQI